MRMSELHGRPERICGSSLSSVYLLTRKPSQLKLSLNNKFYTWACSAEQQPQLKHKDTRKESFAEQAHHTRAIRMLCPLPSVVPRVPDRRGQHRDPGCRQYVLP